MVQMIVAERNYDKERDANAELQRTFKGKPQVRELICLMQKADATTFGQEQKYRVGSVAEHVHVELREYSGDHFNAAKRQ